MSSFSSLIVAVLAVKQNQCELSCVLLCQTCHIWLQLGNLPLDSVTAGYTATYQLVFHTQNHHKPLVFSLSEIVLHWIYCTVHMHFFVKSKRERKRMDTHSISMCNYYSSIYGIKCKIIKYKAHHVYIHDKGNGFPGCITVIVTVYFASWIDGTDKKPYSIDLISSQHCRNLVII